MILSRFNNNDSTKLQVGFGVDHGQNPKLVRL